MNLVGRMVTFSMLRNAFVRRIGYLGLLGVLTLFIVPDTSLARVIKVFGPENFVRSSGRPAAEVRQFEVQSPKDSEFNLHVFYGGLKKDFKGIVPSAVVKLNGRTVVTPNDLNRNTHYIKKPVTLSETNRLSVELRGSPGSGLRVVITGKNHVSQLFHLKTDVIPDGIELFGLDLNYTWTIVDQPEGGYATLSDPYSPSTSFSTGHPGGYTLELTIRGATWTESFPIKLTATEYPIFIPVPVQTRVISGTGTQYQDFSIKVGSHTYTAPAPASCGSPSYEGFQVLVLDRGSLAFKDHRTFNMPCGKQAMTTFLTGLDNTSIVIVSSLKGAEPSEVCDFLAGCTLGTVFQTFGGSPVYSQHNLTNLSYTLPDGTPVPFSYSLIGIKGVGIYNGTEMNNWDHTAYKQEPKINSNISGYFVQDDSTDHWTFVYPEFIEIETRSQPSSTGNTIKVGNASYHSRPLMAGAVGGFQVLCTGSGYPGTGGHSRPTGKQFDVLDQCRSGKRLFERLAADSDATNLAFCAEMAEEYNQRFLVVISSIGTPIQYKSPDVFAELARIIGWYYGGTTGVFNQLGTTPDAISTYSLVGVMRTTSNPYGPGAVDSVEASSTWASLKKENLRVVVHKDKQGFFMPATTYAGDQADASYPDFNLLSVALQPPTPWPLPNPADPLYQQQQAAYEYISSHVGEGLDQKDIRSCYAMRSNGDWQANCNSLEYSEIIPAPTNFTEAVFEQMKTQLCDPNYGEFNYVTHVNGFKDDLGQPPSSDADILRDQPGDRLQCGKRCDLCGSDRPGEVGCTLTSSAGC